MHMSRKYGAYGRKVVQLWDLLDWWTFRGDSRISCQDHLDAGFWLPFLPIFTRLVMWNQAHQLL